MRVGKGLPAGMPGPPGKFRQTCSPVFKPGLAISKEEGILLLQHNLLQLVGLAGCGIKGNSRSLQKACRQGHSPLCPWEVPFGKTVTPGKGCPC